MTSKHRFVGAVFKFDNPVEGGHLLIELETRIKEEYPKVDIGFDIERNIFCIGKIVAPECASDVKQEVQKLLGQLVNVGRANKKLWLFVIDAFEGASEQNT